MLQAAIPLLPALNLRATIDFYETRLGFTGINMGNYAIVKCGAAEIHFYLVNQEKFHPATCLIYSHNMEDLYTSFAGKDMLYVTGQIKDIRAGSREFSILDNNGNVLRFSKQKT